MKKTVLLFLVSLFFISCASTGAGKSGSSEDDFEEPPLFLDWQYKGFGQEYPKWAEEALKEGESATVSIQFGQNLDMLLPHEYEQVEETEETEPAEEKVENVVKQTWVYIDPYYDEYEKRYVYIRVVALRQAQGPQFVEE